MGLNTYWVQLNYGHEVHLSKSYLNQKYIFMQLVNFVSLHLHQGEQHTNNTEF